MGPMVTKFANAEPLILTDVFFYSMCHDLVCTLSFISSMFAECSTPLEMVPPKLSNKLCQNADSLRLAKHFTNIRY